MSAAIATNVQELVIPEKYIYVVLLDRDPIYVGCSDEPERIGSTLVDVRKKLGHPLHGRVAIKVVDFNSMPTVNSGGRGNALTNLENLLISMHAWQTGSFHCNGIQRGGTKKGGWIKDETAFKVLMTIYHAMGLPTTPNATKTLALLEWDEIEKKRDSAKALVMYAESVAKNNPQTRGLRFAHCTKNTGPSPHLTGNAPKVVCIVPCGASSKVAYPLKPKP